MRNYHVVYDYVSAVFIWGPHLRGDRSPQRLQGTVKGGKVANEFITPKKQ